MNLIKFTLVIITLLLISTAVGNSETNTGEEINWNVISSGGGEVTSTNYKVNLTIGQPVVGFVESSSYNVNLGFWQNFEASPSCCVMRGDVYLPKDGKVLVNDIVYLVNYLFRGGLPPNCFIEGDCYIPLDNDVLVNDIVYLVNFLFRSGVEPPPC